MPTTNSVQNPQITTPTPKFGFVINPNKLNAGCGGGKNAVGADIVTVGGGEESVVSLVVEERVGAMALVVGGVGEVA